MRRRVVLTIIGWSAAAAANAGEPVRVAAPDHPRALASEARLDAAPPADEHRVHLDDPRGHLRSGFGGTLINFFPVAESRFHLSAGERLFARPRANKALDERGLLAAPRLGGGWRPGRRFAPALLMGIDEPAGNGVSLGFDAGVVMGPAMERGMRAPRGFRRLSALGRGGGGGGGGPRGPNGVARLTMDYRF